MYTDSAKITVNVYSMLTAYYNDHLSIVTTDLQKAKLSGILNFTIFFLHTKPVKCMANWLHQFIN